MGAVLPYVLAASASAATLIGGLVALRLRGRQGLITAFSAGIVIGVALFDLLPEALSLAQPTLGPQQVFTAVAFGLAVYLVLVRSLAGAKEQGLSASRFIAPAALTLHSLVDGLGIGLGFELSATVGWSIALAVLSHDVADGVNIVSVSANGEDYRTARRWLAINVAAPLLGVLLAQLVHVSDRQLVPILSALAGVFLYIGAVELLPRSQRLGGRTPATAASVAGLAIVYLAGHLHG
jgi:zinc transporter ZupT